MLSNTLINEKSVQAYNSEIILYTQRELCSGPAVLVGGHTARCPRRSRRTRTAFMRRAGAWVGHGLASLVTVDGGQA